MLSLSLSHTPIKFTWFLSLTYPLYGVPKHCGIIHVYFINKSMIHFFILFQLLRLYNLPSYGTKLYKIELFTSNKQSIDLYHVLKMSSRLIYSLERIQDTIILVYNLSLTHLQTNNLKIEWQSILSTLLKDFHKSFLIFNITSYINHNDQYIFSPVSTLYPNCYILSDICYNVNL